MAFYASTLGSYCGVCCFFYSGIVIRNLLLSPNCIKLGTKKIYLSRGASSQECCKRIYIHKLLLLSYYVSKCLEYISFIYHKKSATHHLQQLPRFMRKCRRESALVMLSTLKLHLLLPCGEVVLPSCGRPPNYASEKIPCTELGLRKP